MSVKQRRTTRPRDVGHGREPVDVRWRKTQYRCRVTSCRRRVFTESLLQIPPRARLTERLRRQVGASVNDEVSVAGAAAAGGVSWPVAQAAHARHADRLLAAADAEGDVGPGCWGSTRPAAGGPAGNAPRTAPGGCWTGSRPTSSTSATGTAAGRRRCSGRPPAAPATPAAAWLRTALGTAVHSDVERPGRRGPQRTDHHRLHRQGGAAAATRRRPPRRRSHRRRPPPAPLLPLGRQQPAARGRTARRDRHRLVAADRGVPAP